MKKYRAFFSKVDVDKLGNKIYKYMGHITFLDTGFMFLSRKAYLLAPREYLDCNYLEIEEF